MYSVRTGGDLRPKRERLCWMMGTRVERHCDCACGTSLDTAD